MESKKLTQQELEALVLIYQAFDRAYKLATGKTLEGVDQLVDLINTGKFTFDDVFEQFIDVSLRGVDDDILYFWEDNMDMFSRENYWPNDNKTVKDGAWIKIRTENGFEVHYAKKSMRKRRFEEELEKTYKSTIRLMKRELADVQDMTKPVKDHDASKQNKMEFDRNMLRTLAAIGLKPYEVKISRTKSKLEYYLPSQYEIIDDVEQFANAYMEDDMVGIKARSLYSSKNEDAIFYLQSRGIPRKVAEMMAAMKQTYFIINMKEMMCAHNEWFKDHVKFVEQEA